MQTDYLALYRSVHQRFLNRRDRLKNLTAKEEDEYLEELDDIWGRLTPGEQKQVNQEVKRGR